MPGDVTSRDRYVVDTGPLREIIRTFVTDWSRTRTSDGGRFTEARGASAAAARWSGEPAAPTTHDVSQLRPFEFLAAESGVPEWRIEKIAKARHPTTELRVADALVTVIGCPEVFHDGTLEVRPNPRAAAQGSRRATTSLTGITAQ